MIDIEAAFRVLVDGGVDFIAVGGVAARAHDSARLTNDLDVAYRHSPENISRLASALRPHSPYLRGPTKPALPMGAGHDPARPELHAHHVA